MEPCGRPYLPYLSGYQNDGEYVLSTVAEQAFDSFLFSFLGVTDSTVDSVGMGRVGKGKEAFAIRGGSLRVGSRKIEVELRYGCTYKKWFPRCSPACLFLSLSPPKMFLLLS